MDVFEYSDKIFSLTREGRYDEAIAACGEALEHFPNDSGIFGHRACAWQKKGEQDKALEDYGRMIAARPESPGGWNSRGNLYHDLGEYDLAIADYTEAIARMPGHSFFWVNRGISRHAKRDLDAALEDFNKSLEVDPEFEWAYANRGLVWIDKGDFDRAVCDYTVAGMFNPKDVWILEQRAYCWFMKRDYDKAIANYTAAIALKGDDGMLWMNRAVCYWNKSSGGELGGLNENIRLAIKDFSRVIELESDNAEAYCRRGEARRYQAWAYTELMKAIMLDRAEDEAARLVLMRRLEHIGYKELIPLFNGFLVNLRSTYTELESAVFKCAGIFAKDDLEEALADFDRALVLEPDNADTFFGRGRCHALNGDKERALADYDQACALDPDHQQAAEERDKLLDAR
jgi:tetratricopeptide (TPR) repeat protein